VIQKRLENILAKCLHRV